MSDADVELLDELRVVAQNGLRYADDPYDRERYERILELVADRYADLADLDAATVEDRFADRVGHVTPNVGGRAAVFDDEGRILLIRRSDDGTWCLPGGFGDPGETPAETAIREAREETGLAVQTEELVDLYYRAADEANPHGFVGAVYVCRVAGGTRSASHEADALEYWHVDAVPAWHKDNERVARDARETWRRA